MIKYKNHANNFINIILLLFIIVSLSAYENVNTIDTDNKITSAEIATSEITQIAATEIETTAQNIEQEDSSHEDATIGNGDTKEYDGIKYTIIEVDGGDKSGSRQANVAVDIGFGDRIYWGFTNQYGQLIAVVADKIILQDNSTEPVNSDGRYYNDEAAVPGTEREDLDQGHVIADSLGGVSNAYNITPQDSTLNRYGDQAYMEKVIRDAGGCSNFVATITYTNTKTQIPSHYHFEYDLKGNHIIDDFNNENPEKIYIKTEISSLNSTTIATTTSKESNPTTNAIEDLASVDTNGDGKVTIAEAKAAGYAMPIKSDCWLYKYMDDRDHDGMVGE